jgi:hypothetical protein
MWLSRAKSSSQRKYKEKIEMAKAIESYKIGANCHAEFIPDAAGTGVWEGIQGPNNTSLTSGEFLLAQTMGGTELKLIAGDDAFTTTTGPTVVTVLTASASGGTFAAVETYTIPADTTFAEGADIFQYIPPREQTNCYAKLRVTVTTDDLSASSLDAFIVGVA